MAVWTVDAMMLHIVNNTCISEGVTSSEKIARDLELSAERSRAIKERFENGELFNDENQPPRNREIDDRALFNEGLC